MIHGNHSSAVREVIPAHDDKRVLARSDKYCPEGRFYPLRPFQNIIALLIFSFLALSCHTGTEPANSNIHLTAADIGVTDAYVRLTTAVPTGADTLVLRRDGITILTLSSSYFDTVLHFDSLLPRHSYRYTGYAVRRGRRVDSSNVLAVTMLDTTSHDFHFRVDTIGDGANSILRDVAIINDSLAMAVGELYLKDSAGHFENTMYNIGWWNGSRWKADRAYFQFQNKPYVTQLYSVFAFNKNDIWVGSTAPAFWNGREWYEYPNMAGIFDAYINKMWGTSDKNMYIVGTNGSIAHFNGSSWEKMESGTTTDLLDITGDADDSTVWACGWSDFKPSVILRYTKESGKWKKVWEENNPFTFRNDSLAGTLTSIFRPSTLRLMVSSQYGVYEMQTWNGGTARRESFADPYLPGFPFSLRGNGCNDYTIVGEYEMFAHFNGRSWRYYSELYNTDGRLYAVAQKGNLIVAAGLLQDPINRKGVVIIGKR